jgi:hypothetical protein
MAITWFDTSCPLFSSFSWLEFQWVIHWNIYISILFRFKERINWGGINIAPVCIQFTPWLSIIL